MDHPDIDTIAELLRIYGEGLPAHLQEQFQSMSMAEVVALSRNPDDPLVRELSEEAREKLWLTMKPFRATAH